jgi:dCTP deaminase
VGASAARLPARREVPARHEVPRRVFLLKSRLVREGRPGSCAPRHVAKPCRGATGQGDPQANETRARLPSTPVILSDRTIREELANGRIVIDPLDPEDIQPSSVDLRLDRFFRVFRNHTSRVIDVKEDQESLTELVEISEQDAFILHPGEFVLGSTAERVTLPDDLVARLEGKSSLGRLGLLIHSTAGFVDAGWDGHLTLELSNVATLPITLYPGMKIGQISFLRMTTPADQPYGTGTVGSKYQGQRGPTPSRYFENFKSRS